VSTFLGGNKWFKRLSNVSKDGALRISMKCTPESLTVDNPQLHYMLRLCQDDKLVRISLVASEARDLYRSHPLEINKMVEREFDALGELAVIVTFIQSLSSVAQIPEVRSRMGHMFVSGYSNLENELRQPKADVNFGEFAILINNLLEPGMASGALTTLDQYLLEKLGTKDGFLYQDLVDDSVSNIYHCYEQQKAKSTKAKADYLTPAAPEGPQRRFSNAGRRRRRGQPIHLYTVSHPKLPCPSSLTNNPLISSKHWKSRRLPLPSSRRYDRDPRPLVAQLIGTRLQLP
jgi:hypothetical protein